MIFKNILLFFCLIIISCAQEQPNVQLTYPAIIKKTVTDTIGSTLVVDPYRNLEDLKDTKVLSWFKQQGTLTDSVLGEINIENRIYNQLVDIENASTKGDIIETYRYTDNGEYYILKRKKDQDIAKLYYKKDLASNEKLVFDPAIVGERLAINYFKLSPNYSKIAISLAQKGVEASIGVILDLVTQQILPDKLQNITPDLVGGINWLPDSSGFYYLRLPHLDPQNPTYLENSKAFLHYISTPENQDIEVFSVTKTSKIPLTNADFPIVQTRKTNPTIILGRVSGNSPYKDLYFSKIKNKNSYTNPDWKPLFKQSDQIDQYFIKKDTLFYRTSKNASNFKICKALIGSDYSKGEVLVEELQNAVISDFVVIDDDIYYTKVKDGINATLVYISSNKSKNIPLPHSSGTCYIRSIKNNIVVSTTGWTKSSQSYLYTTKTKEFIPIHLKEPKYPTSFNNLIIEEVEVASHDGVKVPLSIIRHPDTKLDGTARIKISAYGAYGDSFTPHISIANLNWVTSGNIYAFAHVRGGGEKGDAWHKGGFKTTKVNSWKDYIACTEYLIEKKYTSKDLTIATGTSAGAITVVNAIVERPDLYKASIILVGFINATRSEFQPNGANSTKEFGALAISEEAQGLIDMDAYLKLKNNVEYPAFYAYVGLEDGAVAPWDSAKFVARLQNDTTTKNPALLFVDGDGGHSGGGTEHSAYQIYSDADAFALWQTGHPDYQPKN